MKALVFATAYLFLVSLAAGRCPNVRVEPVEPSSQKVRVTVLHDGAPSQRAKIEIFTADEQSRRSPLSTDEHGVAVLPLLAPGRYHVVATADGGLRADLYLDVSKKKRKATSFSMELFIEPPPPPSLEEKVVAAERSVDSARFQQLRGVVRDPSGAVVAGTKIEIFRRGSWVEAESDEVGRFSVHLSDGAYTAVFMNQGFSPSVAVFEVGQNGDKKDLRIVLQVAPVTE